MDTALETGDLGDLLDARRRIVAAFEGIAAGAEALAARAAEAEELDSLRAQLEEERTANAQLESRLASQKARGGDPALEAEVQRLRDEVARLRAEREEEKGELDAVLSELIPLVEEAR